MAKLRFSAGPWNVGTGADAFGPSVRNEIPLEEKIRKYKEIGLDAIQFHDDDAVPDLNNLSEDETRRRARELKVFLDDLGLQAEFSAPRLWEDPRTIDGAYTSNCLADREYAMWRTKRAIDISRELGCHTIVLWLAREGTLCYESKNPVESVRRVAAAVNEMLDYDPDVRILIETKPNEPIDRSFCPTIGHAVAIAATSKDPARVGALLETAHAVLAGLDPANEIAFALSFGKLWSVHLNDQNSLRYDQDKSFGVENLRQAFNQIRVLIENNYGENGEFVGLDVKAMRTQRLEGSYKHLENSIRIARMLEEKARKFDYRLQSELVQARDYESLEMYVMELLMEG